MRNHFDIQIFAIFRIKKNTIRSNFDDLLTK
jgi:hypothetical protein